MVGGMIRSNGPKRAMMAAFLAVVLTGGCGTGSEASPSSVPTPLPVRTAGNFAEFTASFCPALLGMLKAIGNPDTGSDSELTKSLDQAITQGNLQDVETVARQIQAELEGAHRLAAASAGWPPAGDAAGQLERLLGAFSAMIEAKRAAANLGLAEADRVGQDAWERAGGLEAWTAMIAAVQGIPEMGQAGAPSCP